MKFLRLFLLICAATAFAAEPKDHLTKADKEMAAIPMLKMWQANAAALHATVQLRDAQLALRDAMQEFESVDAAREKLLQARLRLAQVEPDADKARQDWSAKEKEILERVKAPSGCHISIALDLDCPGKGTP